MLVSKNAKICITPNVNTKICVTPNVNAKICVAPMRNPKASQWNIGYVGSPGVGACIGHVQLFVSISFALGSQRVHSFQWNMGLRESNHVPHYV